MGRKTEIQDSINRLLEEYFSIKEYEFMPGQTKIPLQAPNYGSKEAAEAMDSILTTFVTMGKKVREFEKLFASYMGVKFAVMVNSGSTANLLALSILSNPTVEN